MFAAKALLFSAFAACVAAQSKVLFFTQVPSLITDGDPAAISYSTNDTESPVTIILRQGQSGNLQTIMTLTDSSHNSQYIWTPKKSLPNGSDYALQIEQGTQTNYFGPFTIQGANPAAVSAASANSTMTTATAATTTGNSTASMGTATTMNRNTTMESASLTKTKTNTKTAATNKVTTTKNTNTNTNAASTSGGAGFQGTSTGASGPSNTGNAAPMDLNAGSSLALAFGAVAAVFYLA